MPVAEGLRYGSVQILGELVDIVIASALLQITLFAIGVGQELRLLDNGRQYE